MPVPPKSLDAVKRLWPALKWGMFLLVFSFVAWHGWQLWTGFDQHARPIHWSWLLLAIVASVVAWLPSLWYWRELMSALGATAPWAQVARAYYCGHLGKYVPGKGAPIVIRSAFLKKCGVPATTSSLTVTIEVLTCMWVGLLVVIALYPALAHGLPESFAATFGHPYLGWCVFAGVAVAGLVAFAIMLRSHRTLTNWMRLPSKVASPAGEEPHGRLSPAKTLAGIAGFVASWWIQGLSLGLTIQSVSESAWNWSDWPFWTGTSAVAIVGGFLAVFAPGGLGVREGLLMELLERQLGPRAVLVALLLRGVTLVGDLLVGAALYYGVAETPKVEGRKQRIEDIR